MFDSSRDKQVGAEMLDLIRELYPICRSITGNGVRRTLQILQRQVPLTVHEVASGTQVFDWTVPKEWNIKGAFIKNPRGEKVLDFAESTLHVVNYSVPFHGKLPLEELKKHIFTLPDRPGWIPYRTSYYRESWGFCMAHERLLQLTEGDYEVCIDASLENGRLSYGECYLPGQTPDEVLISCHICHPSLCNDNLSGIALMVALAKHLQARSRRYSYRLLFIPGTIGSITWLALNEHRLSAVKHGFVIAGVGDRGAFTYKKSRRGDAEIDQIFACVLRKNRDSRISEFSPYGYDERQFCSPGFNLPIGCVMRTPHGQYPEYHTSADNLDFISSESLTDSLTKCILALRILEANKTYINQNPKGEPQLGRRGLYREAGGQAKAPPDTMTLLWVLNLCDGDHCLLDIAVRSGCDFDAVEDAINLLKEHGLLKERASE